MKKQHEGVTLLEIILVLAISGAILFLSIMQYLTYRRDVDVFQLQTNVDALFQAMGSYYKQQCFGTAPNQIVSPGKLNPDKTSPLPDIVAVDIPTDLVDTGFLTSAIPFNPIVKATGGSGTKGYVAQFNLNPMSLRQVCREADKVGPPGSYQDVNTCSSMAGVGIMVSWRAQIAVQLNDPAQAKQYLALLGGDCLSTATGDTVLPCSSSGNTGTYVVWERVPSRANTRTTSSEWVSTPRVNFFTQMYTTYPINYAMYPTATKHYYLCGN